MKNSLSALRLILTLSCEESTRIVSDSLDRKLSGSERWAVRLHYLSCWSCRRFGKQMRQLRTTLESRSDKQTAEALSPAARQRIEQAIARVK